MSQFRFDAFPRPLGWNPGWNPAMMIPGWMQPPPPVARPPPQATKKPEIVPFIPPSPSPSDLEEEERQAREEEKRRREQADEEADRKRALREKEEEKVIKHRLVSLKAYRFRHSKNSWKHLTTYGVHASPAVEDAEGEKRGRCSEVQIVTWNVDMASPKGEERLEAALRHLEHKVIKRKKDGIEPEPCVIMLQELRDMLMPFLLRDEWVRAWFIVTPFTKDKWPEGSYYGNVTLVSRSISIAEAHILHFGVTEMQRTAVCVKIRLDVPGTEEKVVMALVNTHLESLERGAKARPKQLEMCARFLTLEGVSGGVVVGDMNAIGPEDDILPRAFGLKDSWRKGDDVEKGKTWGYQGQNPGGFPCARLDKILFLRGADSYKVKEPERIGIGLKTDDDEPVWVSDHYGLETTLKINRKVI